MDELKFKKAYQMVGALRKSGKAFANTIAALLKVTKYTLYFKKHRLFVTAVQKETEAAANTSTSYMLQKRLKCIMKGCLLNPEEVSL